MYLRTREKCFFFSFLNFDRFGHFLGKLPKGSASFISKAANIQFRKQTWFGILKSLSTYMRLTFFPTEFSIWMSFKWCYWITFNVFPLQSMKLQYKSNYYFSRILSNLDIFQTTIFTRMMNFLVKCILLPNDEFPEYFFGLWKKWQAFFLPLYFPWKEDRNHKLFNLLIVLR